MEPADSAEIEEGGTGTPRETLGGEREAPSKRTDLISDTGVLLEGQGCRIIAGMERPGRPTCCKVRKQVDPYLEIQSNNPQAMFESAGKFGASTGLSTGLWNLKQIRTSFFSGCSFWWMDGAEWSRSVLEQARPVAKWHHLLLRGRCCSQSAAYKLRLGHR